MAALPAFSLIPHESGQMSPTRHRIQEEDRGGRDLAWPGQVSPLHPIYAEAPERPVYPSS